MFFFARGWEFAQSGSRSGSKSKESFTRAVRELSGFLNTLVLSAMAINLLNVPKVSNLLTEDARRCL